MTITELTEFMMDANEIRDLQVRHVEDRANTHVFTVGEVRAVAPVREKPLHAVYLTWRAHKQGPTAPLKAQEPKPLLFDPAAFKLYKDTLGSFTLSSQRDVFWFIPPGHPDRVEQEHVQGLAVNVVVQPGIRKETAAEELQKLSKTELESVFWRTVRGIEADMRLLEAIRQRAEQHSADAAHLAKGMQVCMERLRKGEPVELTLEADQGKSAATASKEALTLAKQLTEAARRG